VKAVDDPAGKVEQQRIDQPHPQAEGQDDEGERKEHQQGLEHHVEQAQQQHHRHQAHRVVATDAGHQFGAEHDAEGQDQPPQQQIDERVVH
jgi:hypothetical protein